MSKKQTTKYSNAIGKGDKSRVTNKSKFDKNWEKILERKKILTEIREYFDYLQTPHESFGGMAVCPFLKLKYLIIS